MPYSPLTNQRRSCCYVNNVHHRDAKHSCAYQKQSFLIELAEGGTFQVVFVKSVHPSNSSLIKLLDNGEREGGARWYFRGGGMGMIKQAIHLHPYTYSS